ncbi:MAG: aminotransferase class IV [Phaeodactylibacter sp.]|nr:aminotransferase class IV [Phaeodactylibacter sp.]MCB9287010.1 aminotransferase class IV [Lewinellaceae bacterium]
MKKLLLETIRCENGRLQNLEWHQERAERSCRDVFGAKSEISLSSISIPQPVREAKGVFKCRVIYDTRIQKTEFTPYSIRPVRSLMVTTADAIKYGHKFADRAHIQAMFEKRGPADDILMAVNGLATDTSYANIALFDGTQWLTPARPLLPGTRRAALLSKGILRPADIPVHSLSEFREIRLINAMMGLEEGPVVLPEGLIFSFHG